MTLIAHEYSIIRHYVSLDTNKSDLGDRQIAVLV
jgi:hypothetical protein